MDCGVAKLILLFISLIFWAAGAGLAYVGHYVIKSFGSFENLIQNKSTLIPAAIIIGISAVMFVVGIVGCCSTLYESKCGLSCFFLIIMLIFVAEVTALVFSFIYRGKINGQFESPIRAALSNYNGEKNSETEEVDNMQTLKTTTIKMKFIGSRCTLQLKCCGVKNYTDWTNTTYFSTNKMLPLSCCKNSSSPQCNGKLEEKDQFNTEGCEPRLEKFIQDVLTYAMLVVVAFAIIKFFGMVSVCAITCKSRRSGYEPLYA